MPTSSSEVGTWKQLIHSIFSLNQDGTNRKFRSFGDVHLQYKGYIQISSGSKYSHLPMADHKMFYVNMPHDILSFIEKQSNSENESKCTPY